MGDMGFQGGFETMKAGKDEEGWMDMVSVYHIERVALDSFHPKLTLGVIFVSGKRSFILIITVSDVF